MTTAAPTTTAAADPPIVDLGDLSGFDLVAASLGDDPLTLALADEPGLRSRGLMGVTDLGDVDGMLFTWGGDRVGNRFTMRNTLIPLTVLFFDVDGELVSRADMVPCQADPCPTYGAAGLYAYAVEFPADREVDEQARLMVGPED